MSSNWIEDLDGESVNGAKFQTSLTERREYRHLDHCDEHFAPISIGANGHHMYSIIL